MGIEFNYSTAIISITSPQTEVTMQELADAISDEEASPWGMNFPSNDNPGMADISGKKDKSGGAKTVFSEIIIDMYHPWQLQFWAGSGVTKTLGGSLIGGLGNVPVKATGTAGDITLVSQPVDGVLIVSGSNLTEEESALLNRIGYMPNVYVFIDEEADPGGDGSMGNPFNVTADAVDYAEANNIFSLMALSDITLERTMKNFTFSSMGLKTIDFAGQNVDKSHFERVKLTGEQVGTIEAQHVVFLPGLTGLNGEYLNIGLAGDVVCAGNVVIASLSTIFTNGHVHHSISMGATLNEKLVLDISKASGALKIQHCNHADKLATIKFGSGHIELDSTNDDGEIGVAGIPDTALTDNTGAGCTVFTDGIYPGAATIKDAVWNAQISDHLLSGTTASYLKNLQILIEETRESHTGTGNIYYVDPINGDSYANGARGGLADPLASVQDCHDNLVVDNHHDIITLIAGDSTGVTELDEKVTLSKNYLFIRGPGRDFHWKSSSIGDVITVTGDGIELKSFQLSTHTIGVGDGIKITGAEFTRVQNVWIGETQGHGISINNSTTILVIKCSLQNCGNSGAGHGISIDPSGGSTQGVLVIDTYFSYIQGSGIIVKSSSVEHVIIESNKFHHCSAYGIDIQTGTLNTFVTLNVLGGNTSGDIRDLGTGTISLNNEQWSTVKTIWEDSTAQIIKKMVHNKVTKSGDIVTIYEDNSVDVWKTFDLGSGGRVET